MIYFSKKILKGNYCLSIIDKLFEKYLTTKPFLAKYLKPSCEAQIVPF